MDDIPPMDVTLWHYGSKHLLRRYLTPQIIPQTLPKKVFRSIKGNINNHKIPCIIHFGYIPYDPPVNSQFDPGKQGLKD